MGSTNSLTTVESSENLEGVPFVIPQKLEDYSQLGENEGELEAEKDKDDVLRKAIFRSAINSLNLEEALSTQSSAARLVTEPEQPFRILHANAAFSRLTGISSDKVIGRVLKNIICVPGSSKICPTSTDNVCVLVSTKKDETTKSSIECWLKTSKVYSGTTLTHLSVDMEKISNIRTDKIIAVSG